MVGRVGVVPGHTHGAGGQAGKQKSGLKPAGAPKTQVSAPRTHGDPWWSGPWLLGPALWGPGDLSIADFLCLCQVIFVPSCLSLVVFEGVCDCQLLPESWGPRPVKALPALW